MSLYAILIGVLGTIYYCHTELSLRKLGLDLCSIKKMRMLDVYTHSIQWVKIKQACKRLKQNTENSTWHISEPS